MAISDTSPSADRPVRTGQSASRYHTERCRYIQQASNPTPISQSAIEWNGLEECPECQRIRREGAFSDINFDTLRAACRRRDGYEVGMERGELIAALRDSGFDPEEVSNG